MNTNIFSDLFRGGLNLTMPRHASAVLWLFLAFLPTQVMAQAYHIVTAATVNGGLSTTVAPGASIALSVSAEWDPSSLGWKGTAWAIAAAPPALTIPPYTCANHGNLTGSSGTTGFNITAPLAPGFYNLYLSSSNNDECGGQGLKVYFTLPNAVTVSGPSPVAVNDSATVAEDSGATIINVRANDTNAGAATVSAITQPPNGTVLITNGGANLSYQPNANYCNNGMPTDNFTYTLAPGGSTATVSVTVTCVDDAPVAVNDSANVNEDAPATPIDVLANDTDIDGGPKSIASASDPANGTVVITGGGTGLTYQPDANYCNNGMPTDNFTYTLAPGGSTATVSVTVTCVDDAPVAVNDSATLTEDDPATPIDVLANDTDIDGGPKSIASASDPANGTVVITGGGTGLTYQPDANYCNNGMPTDNFTYTLAPGGSTATVSVTVTCVDDAPVAVNDSATLTEDDPATTIDVLANDTDIDGGPIAIDSVTQPANGEVVITNGGADLTYEPDADYCNDGSPTDDFTYTLAPGGSTATVAVSVTCVDDPPVANDDVYTATEDDPATDIPVLANDIDVDGPPVSIASATQPANGTVVITGGGTGLTYEPDADYCNDGSPTDDFTYELVGGTAAASVAVTVTCVDDPPVAVDDSATVTEDDPATPIDVLANDTDIDGGPKSIASASDPANGTVVITGGGTGLTYQPDANYCNDGSPTDDFTYTLAPGGSTATVAVTVTCVDDAPVAVNDSATLTEDDPATTIDVLANDTDIDGGPIAIDSVTQPANGEVVITNGGADLTYEPDADYCNDGSPTDDFTYTLAPGGSTATVAVSVTCVDDPPVAVDDSATVTEDDPATPIDVLANDTDIDGGPIAIDSVTQPANGEVVITNGGADLTYEPDADYCNDGSPTDDFTYTLAPGGSTATVAVSVTCVDDPPVAVDDSATVTEDDPATAIDVLANDTDVDGGPIAIDSVTQPANGTVVITGGGTGLTYQPDANYCNDGSPTDDFTYTLTPAGPTPTATVAMTVTCVNDAPVMVSVSASSQTADYSDFIGTVTITATDIDSTSLTLSQTGAPSDLPSPSLNSTTNCTVVPNPSSMDGSTCQWTMDGQVLTPGTNVHNIDFTANDGELDSTCSGVTGVCRHVLTVQPEDADVMLDEDNDVAIQVATAGGTSGTFSLFFSAWETIDPEDFAHDGTAQFGNLNNMSPKMRLTPVGPGGPVDGVCGFVAPLPVYPGEGYGQLALFECVFNAVPVNVYEILATVDNGATASYYQGFDEDMVTIFDPSLGFTTGGGWFYWPDTAITDENDPCFPYAGDKTNFGWNMKYNKKRTNLQGSLLLMRHTLDEFCEEAQYRVKSNALDNMALGTAEDASGPYGWTIFGGKATWREPGADTVGNHRFLVYAEDHGDQGCNQDPSDEFWIEVTDPDGVVLLLLNGSMPAAADPADDGDDEPIACGNIFVPHTRGPN